MAINPKPFNRSDKLSKIEFLPNPSVFTVEDLNREHARLTDNDLLLNESLGAIREGWGVSGMVTSDVIAPITFINTLTVTSLTIAPYGPSGFYVYYKNTRFNAPMSTLSFSGVFTGTAANKYAIAYLVLYAKRTNKTFGTDPTLCGVNSTEYPGAIQSCNATQWSDEEFVLTDDPDGSIPVGKEKICIVYSILPQAAVAASSTSVPPYPDAITNTLIREAWSNAPAMHQILSLLPFKLNDDLCDGFTGEAVDVTVTEPHINESITDIVLHVVCYFRRKLALTKEMFRAVTDALDSLTAQIALYVSDLTAVETALATLTSRVDALPPMAGWTNATPTGTWLGISGNVGRYVKDGIDWVHLGGGFIQSGLGTGQALFTLPAGSRPSTSLNVSVTGFDGTNYIPALLNIDAMSGVVSIVSSTWTVGHAASFVYIDNIHFNTAL